MNTVGVAKADASMAEVLELLAIASREVDKLHDLARKAGAELNDVYEASTELIDTIYNLELLLESESDFWPKTTRIPGRTDEQHH